MKNEKKTTWFFYDKNMANFEVFLYSIKLSINLLFPKSVKSVQNPNYLCTINWVQVNTDAVILNLIEILSFMTYVLVVL